MRPGKARALAGPRVTAKAKSMRFLCSNYPFRASLRFTSLVILFLAACEFSGVTEAFVRAFRRSSAERSISKRFARPYRGSLAQKFGNASTRGRETAATSHATTLSIENQEPLNPPFELPTSAFRMRTDESIRSDRLGKVSSEDAERSVDEYQEKHRKLNPFRGNLGFSLEMHWTETNPSNKVCRIHNACVQSDGGLLVHNWMKAHETHLYQCGVRKIRFMKNAAEFDTEDSYSGIDLFGIQPARFHIPHFLTDVMPMLYASELLRPKFTKPSQILSVCEVEGRHKCLSGTIKNPLFAGLYADSRVSQMPMSSWVPRFVSMIPESPYLVFPGSMFARGKPRCFRSVIAYNAGSYIRRGRQWYGEDNPFFTSNGLSRRSVMRGRFNFETKKYPGRCKANITILNRMGWLKRGKSLMGRDITNVEKLVTTMEKKLKQWRYKNLDASINVAYFDNSTFDEQVSTVQNADVLLGVHGAGLGNLIFARLDTPFVEVMPFGYTAGPFDRVAMALNLKYSMIISEPDTINFLECLRAKADALRAPHVFAKGQFLWATAVKAREKNGTMTVLKTENFRTAELTPVKLCARSQRMTINVETTANMLLEMAESTC